MQPPVQALQGATLTGVGAGGNHGHANDGAHDGVGGGHGQLKVGGQDEPDAGGQQGAQHAVHVEVGLLLVVVEVGNLGADGVGHPRALHAVMTGRG